MDVGVIIVCDVDVSVDIKVEVVVVETLVVLAKFWI